MNLTTIQMAHTVDFAIQVAGRLTSLAALTTIQYPELEVGDDGRTFRRTIPDRVLLQGRLVDGGALAVQVVGGRTRSSTSPWSTRHSGTTSSTTARPPLLSPRQRTWRAWSMTSAPPPSGNRRRPSPPTRSVGGGRIYSGPYLSSYEVGLAKGPVGQPACQPPSRSCRRADEGLAKLHSDLPGTPGRAALNGAPAHFVISSARRAARVGRIELLPAGDRR
jgi:hypothetical protein